MIIISVYPSETRPVVVGRTFTPSHMVDLRCRHLPSQLFLVVREASREEWEQACREVGRPVPPVVPGERFYVVLTD